MGHGLSSFIRRATTSKMGESIINAKKEIAASHNLFTTLRRHSSGDGLYSSIINGHKRLGFEIKSSRNSVSPA